MRCCNDVDTKAPSAAQGGGGDDDGGGMMMLVAIAVSCGIAFLCCLALCCYRRHHRKHLALVHDAHTARVTMLEAEMAEHKAATERMRKKVAKAKQEVDTHRVDTHKRRSLASGLGQDELDQLADFDRMHKAKQEIADAIAGAEAKKNKKKHAHSMRHKKSHRHHGDHSKHKSHRHGDKSKHKHDHSKHKHHEHSKHKSHRHGHHKHKSKRHRSRLSKKRTKHHVKGGGKDAGEEHHYRKTQGMLTIAEHDEIAQNGEVLTRASGRRKTTKLRGKALLRNSAQKLINAQRLMTTKPGGAQVAAGPSLLLGRKASKGSMGRRSSIAQLEELHQRLSGAQMQKPSLKRTRSGTVRIDQSELAALHKHKDKATKKKEKEKEKHKHRKKTHAKGKGARPDLNRTRSGTVRINESQLATLHASHHKKKKKTTVAKPKFVRQASGKLTKDQLAALKRSSRDADRNGKSSRPKMVRRKSGKGVPKG